MSIAYIEEVFNKINTHKGVEGIIISTIDGIPIKYTYSDENLVYYYTTSASIFIQRCQNIVKDLIQEDLTFIRLRTKENEIMIAPDNDFILIVIQNPSLAN